MSVRHLSNLFLKLPVMKISQPPQVKFQCFTLLRVKEIFFFPNLILNLFCIFESILLALSPTFMVNRLPTLLYSNYYIYAHTYIHTKICYNRHIFICLYMKILLVYSSSNIISSQNNPLFFILSPFL